MSTLMFASLLSLFACRSNWCMADDGVLDVRVLAQFVA